MSYNYIRVGSTPVNHYRESESESEHKHKHTALRESREHAWDS